MVRKDLQELCERGQQELMETRYLQAARTLADAEQQAWETTDFDTLARLYLPLQEARRQIRQRCGEGAVHMHFLQASQTDPLSPADIVRTSSPGQLLVAGWGTVQPAVEVRRLAREQNLYLETFLAAVYPTTDCGVVVVIVPAEEGLPGSDSRLMNQLQAVLPPHCLVLNPNDLPADAAAGNSQTFAGVMALWEKLHTPLLQVALNIPDPISRMQAYRTILKVDPACELAHQFLADIARTLSRQR